MYGYMTDSMFPLFTTSIFGEAVATGYTFVYLKYSPNRMYVLRTVAVGAAILVVTTLYVILGSTGVTNQSLKQVYTIHGYIAVAINIFMYASPLEKVRTVVQTKNSSSIPINLSVMIFVNCCFWVVLAGKDRDMFVLTPNAIGLALAMVQISLYFIYRQPKTLEDEISKGARVFIQEVEMGVIDRANSSSVAYEGMRSPLPSLQT